MNIRILHIVKILTKHSDLSAGYLYLYRSLTDSANNQWIQIFLPKSSVLSNYGNYIDINNNILTFLEDGLYVVYANMEFIAASYPCKAAMRVIYDTDTVLGKVSAYIDEASQGLGVTVPIYASKNGTIKIECHHSSNLIAGTVLRFRVSRIPVK